jgi:hypothetical protein
MHTYKNCLIRVRLSEMRGKSTVIFDFRFEQETRDDSLWFTLTEDEVREQLLQGYTAHDLLRRIEQSGDTLISYRVEGMNYRGPDHGKMEVEYDRLHFPIRVWVMLLRYARLVKPKLPAHEDRSGWHAIDLTLSLERRTRWAKMYGQGTGQVETVIDETTQQFLTECLTRDADSKGRLEECVNGVHQIARNSTYSVFETAKVRMSKDWDGLYWEAYRPSGSRIMNGGIVNHNPDGSPSWSTHT